MRTAIYLTLAWLASSADLDAARIKGADAVVVGQITAGQHSGSMAEFRLLVERVLHGDVNPGVILDVQSASRSSATDKLSGIRGMWMLRSGPKGRWRTLSALQSDGAGFMSSVYPVAPTNEVEALKRSLPQLKDPGDFVAAELAAGAENSVSNPGAFQVVTFGLLFHVPHTPGTLAIFKRLHASKDPQVASLGIAGRLMQNDAEALEGLEADLPILRKAGMLGRAARSLNVQVDPSPRNVAAMGRLATSANMPTEVQREAAAALQRIHSRDTLPYLIQLLDSADVEVRGAVFAGLSQFVENLGIVTLESGPQGTWRKPVGPAPYRTAETDKFSGYWARIPVGSHPAYVAFWKAWWSKYGAELTKK